jgi:hypothetical protein
MALAGKAERKSNMDKVKSRPVIAFWIMQLARSCPRWNATSPRRIFLRATIKVLGAAVVISFLAFAPRAALAQNSLESTKIMIGAPAQSKLGEALTVQAVLADSQGHPISKEVIYFTTQSTFLSDSSDVVLAQAMTNGKGQAVAQFVDDFSGTITVHAEFRGDTKYASSDATTQIGSIGGQQVYSEHVGVDIPGLNVPPVGAPMASLQWSEQGIPRFIQSLWPAMNGWPIAAVLLLVWSMYLLALRFVFRVAALGSKPEDLPPFDSRRSL